MRRLGPIKSAMMATISVCSGAAAVGVAHADTLPELTPLEVDATYPADELRLEPELESAKPASIPRWALWVGATAALAALVKLIGANGALNMVARAGPVVAKAVEVVVKAPLKAAKAMGEAFMSPVKFMLLLGGLALFAFTGVGLFDLQWAGGLATGMGLTALAWYGAVKTRRAFSFKSAWGKRETASDV